MIFKGNLYGTTIGSLPHENPEDATRLVWDYVPNLPSWVQLPKYPEERMLYQYNEGIPGLKEENGKLYFDAENPDFEEALLHFYEDYLAIREEGLLEMLERFALSHSRARGFYSFLDALSRNKGVPPHAVKAQITGPFTLGTGLKDQKGRYAFYDTRLRDVVVKHLCLKALWQIDHLKRQNVPVLMFIDEPSLAGFGSSSYLGVQDTDIHDALTEIVDCIHHEQCWAGVHCCENTDWSLILKTNVDVLSFDAYGFFDRLFLYRDELCSFFGRGGNLAWGIVPTHSEKLLGEESSASLINYWKICLDKLLKCGLSAETIAGQSLITPSCGAGSLSVGAAVRVLMLVNEISRALRKAFGFI